MKRYTARGVVLGTLKYGEKGLIVQMLTSSHGRQSYMVQGLGARSRNAKLALFQPMFALEFEGLTSTKMDMHRFGEVHAGLVLQSIPFDVKKSTIALFMAEVLHRLVKESEANEMLFDFVWGSVEALDAATEGVANFHLWFLSHLCRFLGFSPGNEYMPEAWFNIAEGHFTRECPPREYRISQENALILRDMLECDVRYLAEVGLNRHQRVDFLSALMAYYSYHLDTINSVQSIRILQELF
ncbi:MAG: recombination protein O N-terminal domain-containing protein [Alistipes sp.]|nr:recombination protein O N-terminal domain-containing protein [Alistipes sp.]